MKKTLIFILLLFSLNSLADVVVLVNGHNSNSNVWFKHGIYQNLRQYFDYKHHIYVARLPDEAPIAVQAAILAGQLKRIKPDEKIILVGHSTGGVVARFLSVYNKNLNIKSLITIASPHLGSNLALIGNIAGGIIPFLDDSKALYSNIRTRSIFLKNLNYQKHPNICYVSIIRRKSPVSDVTVKQYSQNMNNVPALRGNSRVLVSHRHHKINYFDTPYIIQAVNMCAN